MADKLKIQKWHIPSALGVYGEDGEHIPAEQAVAEHNELVRLYHELVALVHLMADQHGR